MQCDEVQHLLSEYGESEIDNLKMVRKHIGGCPNCRAQQAEFEEMRSSLESLAAEAIEPPSWLAGTITETVSQKAARIAAIRRVENQVRKPQVLTGGAVLAAGIAGAILVRSRRRRRRVIPQLRLRQVFAHT